jgi:adenosylcobinamide-phosphate synthase
MGAVAAGLLAGAVADRVAGDPRRGHPVAAFGRLAAALERRAWRPTRSVGAVHVLALVGGAAAAGAWADRRLRRRPAARALLVALTTWAALGDGPPPGPDDLERAVRLSLLVGAAATALAVAARR